MGITDELREYAEDWIWLDTGAKIAQERIEAIADRIDAEHEEALLNVHIDLMDARGWARLPKDADGKVWRVGDELLDDGMVCEVVGIGPNRLYYYVDATDTVEWTQADSRRHYHAPTVEDVLWEFAEKITDSQIPDVHPTYEEAIAEYAKRLKLAGDAE